MSWRRLEKRIIKKMKSSVLIDLEVCLKDLAEISDNSTDNEVKRILR